MQATPYEALRRPVVAEPAVSDDRAAASRVVDYLLAGAPSIDVARRLAGVVEPVFADAVEALS